jgi:hypothetical protein
MRPTLLALVLLFSTGCRETWYTFRSPEGTGGSFEVLMPAKPAMKPSHMGTIYAMMGSDGLSYDVGVASVPPAFADPSTTERMFDEMQKAITGGETEPTRTKQIRLEPDGYPGREVVVERKTGVGLAVFTGRAYRVRGTIFTLTVRAPADKSEDPQIRKFFDSFRIVTPPSH